MNDPCPKTLVEILSQPSHVMDAVEMMAFAGCEGVGITGEFDTGEYFVIDVADDEVCVQLYGGGAEDASVWAWTFPVVSPVQIQ